MDFFRKLAELVDAYYEGAGDAGLAQDGDGVNLVLLVRKTSEGDIQLELRSVADVVRAATGKYRPGEDAHFSSTSYRVP